jgi:hypothetical protein
MLFSSKVHYPNATPLYFKSDGMVTVGTPESPVTSLYCNHDRVLAFHPMGASSISFASEGDQVSEYALLQGLGCCVEGVNLIGEVSYKFRVLSIMPHIGQIIILKYLCHKS